MMVNKRIGKKEETNLGKTNCIMVQKINHTVTGELYEIPEAQEFGSTKRILRCFV